MQDLDLGLSVLRRGGHSAVLYHWAQGHTSSNAPGGCSTYRTQATQQASAERLHALHPEFVRLVTKRTAGSSWAGATDGAGTRTDVVVSWRRAFEAGQQVPGHLTLPKGDVLVRGRVA